MPRTTITASEAFARLVERERARFTARTPGSREVFARSRSLIGGVPMPWMLEWPNPSPLYAAEARGARLWDADGNEYLDFCLGDTGAMFGHSPEPVVEAVRRRAADGTTTMLPGPDAGMAADLLAARFGLPHWQFALSATDANRFVLRLARALTGRPRVLVFNGCYHGSLDETLVGLDRAGRIAKLSPIDSSPAWPAESASVVVEFNDTDALERALAGGDVAAVLAEPIMTNCGMVLPEDGYHEALRDLTRRYGTYLVIDETHTLSTGYGGFTAANGLEPDFLVFGKAMAGGIPIGGYGLSEAVAGDHRRVFGAQPHRIWGALGVGGTLAANALSMAALRVTLERVATPEAFDHMLRLGAAMAEGLDAAVTGAGLPWSVTRAGARAELQFMERSPRTGGEALSNFDWPLVEYTHLFLLNRGVLITPFHNMMLTAPATTQADVDVLVGAWSACMEELAAIR